LAVAAGFCWLFVTVKAAHEVQGSLGTPGG
jgi:hypothetical protein